MANSALRYSVDFYQGRASLGVVDMSGSRTVDTMQPDYDLEYDAHTWSDVSLIVRTNLSLADLDRIVSAQIEQLALYETYREMRGIYPFPVGRNVSAARRVLARRERLYAAS